MCLISFALRVHPDFPLIVAANRDEFFNRPSSTAHYWDDDSSLFAGRDLSAGGTWLGVNQQGLFSALTNYREMNNLDTDQNYISRGNLTRDFLQYKPAGNSLSIESYFAQLKQHDNSYNGYNLLAGTPDKLGYYSNRGNAFHSLDEGIYGLSNGLLDTPWPKTISCKKALQEAITHTDPEVITELLFTALSDTQPAAKHLLPDTGIGMEWEAFLSPRFIIGEEYGTRTSTVLLFDHAGRITFNERNFTANAEQSDQQRVVIQTNYS
jgi:uncharacterized protein with NRDE domain